MVRNLPAMQETQVQSLDWEYPRENGNGNPLQCSCLENSMTEEPGGLHSPWGHVESHTTECLTLTHTHIERMSEKERVRDRDRKICKDGLV